jgi:hypothetical protein
MKMKRHLIMTVAFLMLTCTAWAQGMQRFNPDKFRADLEKFITVEACLTPAEAAKFFPLYEEMNKKQRALFRQMRELQRMKPADEEACRKAIAESDRIELEMKQIQSNYHTRFLTIISASKLYDVIRAEGKFHRQAVKNAARPPHFPHMQQMPPMPRSR